MEEVITFRTLLLPELKVSDDNLVMTDLASNIHEVL